MTGPTTTTTSVNTFNAYDIEEIKGALAPHYEYWPGAFGSSNSFWTDYYAPTLGYDGHYGSSNFVANMHPERATDALFGDDIDTKYGTVRFLRADHNTRGSELFFYNQVDHQVVAQFLVSADGWGKKDEELQCNLTIEKQFTGFDNENLRNAERSSDSWQKDELEVRTNCNDKYGWTTYPRPLIPNRAVTEGFEQALFDALTTYLDRAQEYVSTTCLGRDCYTGTSLY